MIRHHQNTPDPGFETPTDMLEACHEKVQHFTQLLLRLSPHVQKNGADQAAVEAANRILRYFRIAAPLHHQDEEIDLFPALMKLDSISAAQASSLHADIERLENEHQKLDAMWQHIEPWLSSIAKGQKTHESIDLEAFSQLYDSHMQREHTKVFVYTPLLTDTQRKQICLRMAQRRGLAT